MQRRAVHVFAIVALVVSGVMAAVPSLAAPVSGTVTLDAVADTSISVAEDRATGAADGSDCPWAGPQLAPGRLVAGGGDTRMDGPCRWRHAALLAFDTSAVPAGAVVSDATLTLEALPPSSRLPLSALVTTGAWDESSAATADALPTMAGPASPVDVDGRGTVTADVTATVQALLDRSGTGLALMAADPDVADLALFADRESTDGATLEVTFVHDPDGQPPVVTVTSPGFGHAVWGDVPLSADASDDGTVDRVDFTVDGQLVGTADHAPYTVSWDARSVDDGEHVVAAVAHDAAGNQARALIPVRVLNDVPVTTKLDLALEQGTIDTSAYVRNALYAVTANPELDPAFFGEVPEGPSAWLWRVLLHAEELPAAEQEWVRSYLAFTTTPVEDGGAAPSPATTTRMASTDTTTSDTTTSGTTAVAAAADWPVSCGGILGTIREVVNGGFDCMLEVGDIRLWWDSGMLADGPDGIPPIVLEYAHGFEDAQAHFASLGYDDIGRVDAIVALPVDGPIRPFSLPSGTLTNSTIMLYADTATPAYLAMHEVFHQYEYEYLSGITAAAAGEQTLWFMESSAEWAAHQVLAANDAAYGNLDERYAYSRSIDTFYGNTDGALTEFGFLDGMRQYGAYVVQEWIHHTTGDADTIRQVWEEMDWFTTPVEAIEQVMGGFGSKLDTMWTDLYTLDLAIPGLVDQDETDAWRDAGLFTDGGAYSADTLRPPSERVALGTGDSQAVPVEIAPGGATFIEIDPATTGDMTVELSAPGDALELVVLPLAGYDGDPGTAPDLCAVRDHSADGREVAFFFDTEACEGVSVVVANTDLSSSATPGVVTTTLGNQVDTTITNGRVRLGIHAEGHLNVPGFDPSSGTGTSTVGLRFVPTNADALAPGCVCEGWGVADIGRDIGGSANEDRGGAFGMRVVEADFDATSGRSVVVVDGAFEVTHEFRPSGVTDDLYEIDVTIENVVSPFATVFGGYYGPLAPTYRRVMDWDVEPTAFSEYVTIGAEGGVVPAEVVYTSNDGFASADPRAGQSHRGAVGLFTDYGPTDHGALFDLEFDELDPGEQVTFTLFYGASASSADAADALDAVDADIWSIAEPNVADGATLGEPNTFTFGFRSDAGSVIAVGTEAATYRATVTGDHAGARRQ